MASGTLLGISGSLREGSYNRKLVHAAARLYDPAVFTEADLRLPLYDGDLEAAEGIPAPVQRLADQIEAADAVVISGPEYNKGISGVLKNALDWVSRVPEGAFRNKPVVVVSASAGRTGGETAQFMTLSCLTQLQARLIPGAAVLIAAAGDAFDAEGHLKDATSRKLLADRMTALRAELA